MIRAYYRAVILLLGLLFWSRLIFLAFAFPTLRGMPSFLDWLLFVTASIRFDLMVIGYCMTPFLLLSVPCLFSSKLKAIIPHILRWNVFAAVFVLTLISILDVQHYDQFQDRFNMLGLEVFKNVQFSISFFIVATSLTLIYFAYLYLKKLMVMEIEYSEHMGFLKWLSLIFITALMIRSSFGEHHIDLRHAQVTSIAQMNKIIIPSAYAFDQALRGRR